MNKGQQRESRMAGAQREWKAARDPAGRSREAQTTQSVPLRHLIFLPKSPRSHCRIFSKETVCGGNDTGCSVGKALEGSQSMWDLPGGARMSPGGGGMGQCSATGSQGRSVEKGVYKDGISWGRPGGWAWGVGEDA